MMKVEGPEGWHVELPGAFAISRQEGEPAAGCVGEGTLDSLGLKVGDPFGYWFDFGDDWWHQINVEAIADAVPKGDYPKVTKRVGKSPPQYPEEDE
jgi:Plasmid pRiA4b ORF-3-like protein